MWTAELVDVALSSPTERGLPFSNWSVPKLAEYCRAKGLLPAVTDEWVRRLLRREGLSAQRIRTWKSSKDPHVDRKKTHANREFRIPSGGVDAIDPKKKIAYELSRLVPHRTAEATAFVAIRHVVGPFVKARRSAPDARP